MSNLLNLWVAIWYIADLTYQSQLLIAVSGYGGRDRSGLLHWAFDSFKHTVMSDHSFEVTIAPFLHLG